jgi:hypothetical protein
MAGAMASALHLTGGAALAGAPPPRAGARRAARRAPPRAAPPGGEQPAVGEDLIARLRAAEGEAQRLKAELAAAQGAASGAESDAEPASPRRPSRIDGGDLRRETLAFAPSKERNWLQETDTDFFTGGGPSEAEGAGGGASAAEAAEVRRRLLLGAGLALAAGAFALVPTDRLAPPPSKPLFLYLLPLLRVEALLIEVEALAPAGDYEALRAALARIEGAPNDLQANLRAAASALPDARASAAASAVARDVYEYVSGIDYQQYYDSMGGARGARGGAVSAELFEYSARSARAARASLAAFLALMPREALEGARESLAQQSGLPF